jgi:16S rRNA (guanine1207-N2)-methyltransferase
MPDGHYFEARPVVASRPAEVALTLADGTVCLRTDRGVFSPDRVDTGTLILLRKCPPPPPVGDLLDLGCGYGPIAVTLARRSPHATVWAVDVNERAVELARENAGRLDLSNLRAVTPDAVPAHVRFAGIWSNPPIRIGKEALHELLRRWLARLDGDGRAWLVVQKHLGADSLVTWLTAQGFPATRLGSKQAYRVLEVRAVGNATAPAADGQTRPPQP